MVLTLIMAILFVLISYFIFYVLYISKFDTKGRTLDEKTKEPNDIAVYIKILNIDRKRVNYRHFLHAIYLMLSIDLGLTYFIFYEVPIKNIVLKFLFGLVVIIFILWISIMILRLYFERRGERND